MSGSFELKKEKNNRPMASFFLFEQSRQHQLEAVTIVPNAERRNVPIFSNSCILWHIYCGWQWKKGWTAGHVHDSAFFLLVDGFCNGFVHTKAACSGSPSSTPSSTKYLSSFFLKGMSRRYFVQFLHQNKLPHLQCSILFTRSPSY